MEPFVGEIRLLPFMFAPRGWVQCNGQILPIAQNTALYSLLGTMYGGNGTSTFGLPNLNGRAIVGMGQGPGTTNYPQGAMAGTEGVTLDLSQLPAHTHTIDSSVAVSVPVSSAAGTASTPAGNFFANVSPEAFGSGTANGAMAAGLLSGTTGIVGSNQPHENRMPYLALQYCIALLGIYPARQ